MAHYLRYVLRSLEPVRIADKHASNNGQTESLHYIPGSAVRGLILNQLSEREDFETAKVELFSDRIRFLNAYPDQGGRDAMPSPKGFYEDKTTVSGAKPIVNVLADGNFPEGYKRASVGEFCRIEDGVIRYASVSLSGELKNNLRDEEMHGPYRNAYMAAGQIYVGWIALEEEAASWIPAFREILSGTIRIGNVRSAGLGKCEVLSLEETDLLPLHEYAPASDLQSPAYMLLLSDLTMTDENGEPIGLDLDALREELEVSDLAVSECAASLAHIRGYNRTYGHQTPSDVCYQKGSVFQLTFSGTLKIEAIEKVMDRGLGERRSEGFGRVLFLRDYAKIGKKLAMDPSETSGRAALRKESGHAALGGTSSLSGKGVSIQERETLRTAARAWYRREIEAGIRKYVFEQTEKRNYSGMSKSRIRKIEPIIISCRYDSGKAKGLLEEFFKHEKDKEGKQKIHKAKAGVDQLRNHVMDVLDADLDVLLGIETREKDRVMTIPKAELLTAEQLGRYKLEILKRELHYDSREEG